MPQTLAFSPWKRAPATRPAWVPPEPVAQTRWPGAMPWAAKSAASSSQTATWPHRPMASLPPVGTMKGRPPRGAHPVGLFLQQGGQLPQIARGLHIADSGPGQMIQQQVAVEVVFGRAAQQ